MDSCRSNDGNARQGILKGTRQKPVPFVILLKEMLALDMEETKKVEQNELSGKDKAAREIFDWAETLCQALFAVVILFTFFFRFVTVSGDSMLTTLTNGDRLIISDIGYTPERGDIVVIHDNDASRVHYNINTGMPEQTAAFKGPIIKRVIATEGETVIIDYDNWTISVTDKDGNTFLLEEPYVNFKDMELPRPGSSIYPDSVGHLEKHTVKEGHVFVCGDNRSNSLDSRYVGDIDERKILGKALFRVLPIWDFGPIKHVSYN